MNDNPLKLIWISLGLNLGGVGGGWAITSKLAGPTDGVEFLYVGGVFTVAVALCQLSLMPGASVRLTNWLLLLATLGVVFAWFVGALAIPLFWMFGPDSWISMTLIAFFTTMLVFYLRRSCISFSIKWQEIDGDKIVTDELDINSPELSPDLLKRYEFSYGSVLPGFLDRFNSLILFGLALSMIIGLNLRKIFPEASALAWGVPCLLLCAYSFNMFLVPMLFAGKLHRIERRYGISIRPMSDDKAKQRQRSLGRRLKTRNR